MVGALFVIFAPQIVAVFSGDAAVARHAVSCLRIVSAGAMTLAFSTLAIVSGVIFRRGAWKATQI